MRFELTTTGATSRCSVQLSYGHMDHDRNRTCMSGFADPHAAPGRRRDFAFGHVVRIKCAGQGSNLPLPDLEAGVPPLELPAHHGNSMRREGLEPPCISKERAGLRPAALPFCHLRVSEKSAWKDSNLRSRAPEARALPSYATR